MNRIKKLQYSLMICLMPAMAHAADAVSIINNVVLYIRGPFVAAAGVLGIAICGVLCFKGFFPKMYFFMVLAGVGLILGSSYYYAWIIK